MLDLLSSADVYDVRVCSNSSQDFNTCKVIDDSMLVDSSLLTPQVAGSPEQIFIDLDYLEVPDLDTSHYVVVRAVDSHGNEGADSNLAQLQGPVSPEKNNAAIIAGVLAGVAIIGTAVVGGIFIQIHKRKKVHPTENPPKA